MRTKYPRDFLIFSRYIQLLQDDRALIVVESEQVINIYAESMHTIGDAIARGHTRKTLQKDRITSDFMLAFDESKRMLAFCTTDKVRLFSV